MAKGQIAYETFVVALDAYRLKGDEKPGSWEKLPVQVRLAWEAAARAVLADGKK